MILLNSVSLREAEGLILPVCQTVFVIDLMNAEYVPYICKCKVCVNHYIENNLKHLLQDGDNRIVLHSPPLFIPLGWQLQVSLWQQSSTSEKDNSPALQVFPENGWWGRHDLSLLGEPAVLSNVFQEYPLTLHALLLILSPLRRRFSAWHWYYRQLLNFYIIRQSSPLILIIFSYRPIEIPKQYFQFVIL